MLCLIAVGTASSQPPENVHYHEPFDYERWRRDHPRSAAKRLADLDVGKPRTVRMIYFLPNDRPYRADVVDAMKVVIRHVQTFYSEQMQIHGYGDRTFRFETDEQGEPLAHRVDGQHPDRHYLDNTKGTVFEEIGELFDLRMNIYFLVIDNSTDLINRRAAGNGGRIDKNSGYAFYTGKSMLAASISASMSLYAGDYLFMVALHELGHAFGLHHDFRDGAYIMSYGPPGWNRLSACHAEFLAVHPYFNADSPTEEGTRPTIELISPHTSGRGTSASIGLKVRDSEGVHQVLLTSSGSSRRACRGLAGKKDAVVEFYYYDVIPPDGVASLPNPTAHRVAVHALDIDGNESSKASFVLDVSKWPRPHPQMLEKISGDEQQGPGGIQLFEPFVVSVMDQSGWAIAGVAVTFVVTAGGGTLSIETAFTDASGQAATMLTLGSQPGTNTVEAFVDGLEPVTFAVTSIGQTPHTLTRVSGKGQEGSVGAALAKPFVVSVLDKDGDAIAGTVVTFTVTTGDGTLSVNTATTDEHGRAATTLTLGPQPGSNTVEATVDRLQPVVFTATGKAHSDFNGDGTVGFGDFLQFAAQFGLSQDDEGYDVRFDLDGNGAIGFSDFLIFAGAFGNNTSSG